MDEWYANRSFPLIKRDEIISKNLGVRLFLYGVVSSVILNYLFLCCWIYEQFHLPHNKIDSFLSGLLSSTALAAMFGLGLVLMGAIRIKLNIINPSLEGEWKTKEFGNDVNRFVDALNIELLPRLDLLGLRGNGLEIANRAVPAHVKERCDTVLLITIKRIKMEEQEGKNTERRREGIKGTFELFRLMGVFKASDPDLNHRYVAVEKELKTAKQVA